MTMETKTWTHEFCEAGNGFPGVGENVIVSLGGDIRLLTVKQISSIHTSQWQANWVYLVCEDADQDWDDMDEDEQDAAWENMHHVGPLDDWWKGT